MVPGKLMVHRSIPMHPSYRQYSAEELKALKSLKESKEITIIQADKGKSVVVMDKDQYVEECEKLLSDETTYKKLGTKNPTKQMKGRIQRKLRTIKKAGHLDQAIYDKIYPTSDATPRFYATPKILTAYFPVCSPHILFCGSQIFIYIPA